MSNVVRIKRHLDSETIHLPELREMVGHDVEIVVREIVASAAPDLTGSILRFDDPLEPIDEEWEANA